MNPKWKLFTAIAALIFVASVVWLVMILVDASSQTSYYWPLEGAGEGMLLAPILGLAVGAVGLLLARREWRQNRGVFYERDIRREVMPRAPSRPSAGGFSPQRGVPPSAPGGAAREAPSPSAPPRAPERPKEDELDEDLGDILAPRPGPVPMAPPPPIPYEDLDELEDTGEAVPRMVPDSEAPEPPAAADEWEIEEEVAEEGTPPEPESEPIPAAVGGEPAEKILFSAYYPREVKPDDWQPFRAYMYKDFVAEAVRADARAQFGPRTDIRATTREALQPVPEDALVTALPSVPGLEFDPPQISLRFRGDWRRFDFEFRAHDAPLETGVDGRITFLVEGMIVADVPVSVYVSPAAGETAIQPQEVTVSPYQAIFCSYSHKDTAIVERVERASRYFNFRYLRDVTTLRSGESWNARLLELIDDADIFQLFWSKHAAQSEYVRQEYQHAVELRRRGVKIATFIRPIRWEEPMPVPPPPELAELHFDLIPELAQAD